MKESWEEVAEFHLKQNPPDFGSLQSLADHFKREIKDSIKAANDCYDYIVNGRGNKELEEDFIIYFENMRLILSKIELKLNERKPSSRL